MMQGFEKTFAFMPNSIRQWLFCLKHYALICVFASSPDRLPYSINCIQYTIFAYFLLGFSLVDEQRSFAVVSLQIMLELVLLAGVSFLGLKWKQKLSRFSQTYSALVGVNLVISAVMLPLFQFLSTDNSNQASIESSLLYATMLMVFWNLAVLSQILKRAFEINTVMSAMIAFNYFVVYQFLVIWIH